MTFTSTFILKMATRWPARRWARRVSVGASMHTSRNSRAELASVATARLGGSEKRARKVVAKGQLLVRDRLRLLLDDEPEFEDGLLARASDGLPGDAVVTVVGKVDGRTTCVIANDYTVKAGTWGRRTFEKITRMQELADQIGAPLVYLVDAAGARIDEQFDSYAGRHAWGNIFFNQIAFSGRIPQVCALFGPSPAGSAYVPALCDVTIMVARPRHRLPRIAAARRDGDRRAGVARGDGRRRDALPRVRRRRRARGDPTRRRSPRSACGCRTSRPRGRAAAGDRGVGRRPSTDRSTRSCPPARTCRSTCRS